MQLTVELHEKDVEAFVTYHHSYLPQVVQERKRRRKERLRFTAINLVSTSIGSALPCVIHGSWSTFWAGALIGTAYGETRRSYQDRKRIRQRKQQDALGIAQYAKSNIGAWQIRVDYNGVVVNRRGDTWRYHRDKIGRVVTVPGYTFVYLSADWAFTIPHHAVRPAEYKTFMQALADLFRSPLPVTDLKFTPLEEAAKTVASRSY